MLSPELAQDYADPGCFHRKQNPVQLADSIYLGMGPWFMHYEVFGGTQEMTLANLLSTLLALSCSW